MPVPITSLKRSFTTVAGRWIDPLATVPRNVHYDAVRIHNNSGSKILVIVQEADLPEPDPATYDTTSQMYFAYSPDTTPFDAGSRTRVWVRGESDATLAGLIWPVRN